jgi:serine/threonine-protein kinase
VSEAVAAKAENQPLIIGRYAVFDAIASGGMATVHVGRLLGNDGAGRTVAIKQLHAHYTTDQEFLTMFMDEARIVARILDPNVVPMIDVIESRRGVFLVMEYVHGESFSKLLRTCRAKNETLPLKLATAIVHGVLLGLQAAHDTKDADGRPLDVVHRDVSPQNIIVGADGAPRLLDFGVAKAAGRAQVTREGQIKGKLAYMAPEQIRGIVDRRSDVFAASVVLWEALAGRRLHDGAKDADIVSRVVKGALGPPSAFRDDIPPELDALVRRGLAVVPDRRFSSALDMAREIERVLGVATPTEVGEWVERHASEVLHDRASKVAAMEQVAAELVPSDSDRPPPPPAPLHGEMGEPTNPSSSQVRERGEEGTARMDAAPLLPALAGLEAPTGTVTGSRSYRLEGPKHRSMLFIGVVSFVIALAVAGVGVVLWSYTARRVPAPAAGAGDQSSTVNSAPPASAP